MTRLVTTAALFAAALTAAVSPASAKDWIESVEVTRDGIDVIPVKVAPTGNHYTTIKTGSHRFLLALKARATKWERIVAMKLGTFKGVHYFEADGALWSQSFRNRDVGSGSKRTVAISYKPVIPVAKLNWQGWTPQEACMLNMDKQIKKGMTKQEVLAKSWTTSAKAYFELDAVAARKGKAEKNKWSISNTTHQRDGYAYDVPVLCLPGN